MTAALHRRECVCRLVNVCADCGLCPRSMLAADAIQAAVKDLEAKRAAKASA